ncbi:MAG TPA: hypothetical protein VFR81_29205 [Longimicrobium sp.]|nr:hypothetical protein [Longimicrobium sp.]
MTFKRRIFREHRRRRLGPFATVWAALVFLTCGEPAEQVPPAASAEKGEVIPVTSDPGATYHLLRWSTMPGGNREALTRRDGRSGTSYARREIDCEARTFRYLGEGDSEAEAEADSPDPGDMGELVPPSISAQVADYVCGK